MNTNLIETTENDYVICTEPTLVNSSF